MKLAIFDLDNTLIPGDSESLWSNHLVESGVLPREIQRREHARFDSAYRNGTLNIYEYMEFQLRPLADNDFGDLLRWRGEFLRSKAEPVVLPPALELLESHRARGHGLLIITAANRFVAEPFAELFAVDHLIATEPEFTDRRYTGRVRGVPSFAAGKVTRLREWLGSEGIHLEESWFYTDSHNDLPLLGEVTHPVAVDPDDELRRHAEERGWPVITLRRAGNGGSRKVET